MMKFFCCFFFYGASLLAQSEQPIKDTLAFKSKLTAFTAKISTIESDFVQEKNLSILSEKIVTKGKFIFKKENKLRWEYTEPFEYLIVLNGNDVVIKDGERVKKYDMQSNKVFGEINDLMIELIQGKVVSGKKYEVTYMEDEKNFIMNLTPLDANVKSFMNGIKLFLDKNDYSVTRIKMLEDSGDYTNIDFRNKRFNATVADEEFVVR